MTERFSIRLTVAGTVTRSICTLLSLESGLSKERVKDAMNKGAVFRKTRQGARRRCRRAADIPKSGEILELHYDQALLGRRPPQAQCLDDRKHYSVWLKPAGLMTQGNQYGDHCSLERQAECTFQPRRPVFLVHRLDQEADGLVVLAHSKSAAAEFSRLFRERLVRKVYRLEVKGDLGRSHGAQGRIDLPLDGKDALTLYEATAYQSQTDTTLVLAELVSGRFHQLRRHFNLIGHPVMGDPRYGSGNKNTTGLCLTCVLLEFDCPFMKKKMRFDLDCQEG